MLPPIRCLLKPQDDVFNLDEQEPGRLSALVVWDVDRLTRSPRLLHVPQDIATLQRWSDAKR